MKKRLLLIVLVILLNLVMVSASCGDGVCDVQERNSKAAGVFCPQDCEGGSSGICYSDLDCDVGFVCTSGACNDPSDAGTNEVLVEEETQEETQTQNQDAQTLSCTPTPYLSYDAVQESYILDDGFVYLTVKLDGEDISFSSLGDILIYSLEENFLSQVMVLQRTTGSNYDVISAGKGGRQEVSNIDLSKYGLPLLNVNDEILYTYSSNPTNFLFGEYYITIMQGKVLSCQLEEILSECSDRKDNNENFRVDYTGGCDIDLDASIDAVCWCDYDVSGDASFDEYVDSDLCEGYDYYCEDFEGNVLPNGCVGDYYYYEEACFTPEDSEGDGGCTETNLEVMGGLCLENYLEFTDGLDCIQANAVEMDLICESMLGEEEIVSCLVHEDCMEGQVCDAEFLSCVNIEAKVEQENLIPCKKILDCKKGLVCAENYCVEDPTASGIITGDNPFLSPFKNGAEALGGFVNRNDPEYLAKQAANKNRELMELEKRNELGLIPENKMGKIRDDTLDFSAKRLNQASEVLNKNLQNSEMSDLVIQRNMLQLENVVGGVGKNLGGEVATFNKFRNQINVGEDSVVAQRVGNKLGNVGNERLGNKLPEGANRQLNVLTRERERPGQNVQRENQDVKDRDVQENKRNKRPSSIRVQEESQTLRGAQNTLNQERGINVPAGDRTGTTTARDGATARDGTTAREGATAARTGAEETTTRTGTGARATRATRESGTSTFQAQKTNTNKAAQGSNTKTGTAQAGQSETTQRSAQTRSARPAKPAKKQTTNSGTKTPRRRPALTGGAINELREDGINIFDFVFVHDW